MSPNSPIPPSPEEDASFQKMLTALLSRAVSGAAAEQIAVKADLSRIVPENGVMPDH